MRVLAFLAFFLFWTSISHGENIIRSTIKGQKFNPDEIHIKSDTPVVFQVTNEDSVPVEFESLDLNKEKIVWPGKTIDIPLKGLKPGVYEFFSDFGPKDLKGKIIVE
ncbi:MAG: cupredoxin domain-containing protein [Nitrospirae bacterium]|nr:cupredoxin domain-containing protein [Nitrospirota bacterium]MBI3353135.1 cupredoxin domain-containing protein [Nitrospirota bacterium]